MRLILIILLTACFSISFYSSSSQDLVEEKIVFAQPFKLKSSGIYDNYASALIEDSITKRKVTMVRADRKVVFSLLDADWKLLNSFETVLDKKSSFLGIYPKVASCSIQGDVWTAIVEGNVTFSIEKIDFGNKSYDFVDKIFEDRDKDYTNRSFVLNNSTYNIYMTKKGDINMAVIEPSGKIYTHTLDLSTQQVVQRRKKFEPKIVFDNLDRMGPGLVQIPELTYKKFHYYTENENLVISAVYEQPVAELMIFDWNTGKKIRTDVFSVEDLLPLEEKNSGTNSTVLLYDNKVWVLAAYKNGGVLGVFDRNTKKLLYHLAYSDQSSKDIFNFGPVFYKAVPGTISGYKEKLDDVTLDEFCKDVYRRNTALTIQPLNSNEYVVTLGSYDEIKILNDRTGRKSRIGPSLQGGFPERMAAGIIFSRKDLKVISKKISYNELNNVDLSDKYEKSEKPVVKTTDPEYSQKKGIFLQSQSIGKRSLTMYLYEGQFKILESIYE